MLHGTNQGYGTIHLLSKNTIPVQICLLWYGPVWRSTPVVSKTQGVTRGSRQETYTIHAVNIISKLKIYFIFFNIAVLKMIVFSADTNMYIYYFGILHLFCVALSQDACARARAHTHTHTHTVCPSDVMMQGH
jgi:hypothetical protein